MRDLYPDERLLENFLEQELVARDRVVAEKLVELTKDQIIELSKNGQLYTTGDTRGLNLYFILSGSVELQNDEGEKIATLQAGQAVGEFPIIEARMPSYTVTVVAREPSLMARLSKEQFDWIANKHPEVIWKNMATQLVSRLKRTTDEFSQLQKQKEPELRPPENIRELFECLKPGELWSAVSAVVAAFTGAIVLAYKFGAGSL